MRARPVDEKADAEPKRNALGNPESSIPRCQFLSYMEPCSGSYSFDNKKRPVYADASMIQCERKRQVLDCPDLGFRFGNTAFSAGNCSNLDQATQMPTNSMHRGFRPYSF